MDSEPTTNKAKILEAIAANYCGSRDFNGLAVTALCETNCPECPQEDLVDADLSKLPTEKLIALVNPCTGKSQTAQFLVQCLKKLVDAGDVTVVYDLNPHIRRMPDLSIEKQLKVLEEKFQEVCVYPTAKHVAARVRLEDYNDRPYKKRLWHGDPQLTPVYFDLEVLENYSNDPRYRFNFSDISGSIFLSDSHYESLETKPKDRTYLEHFGLGFRESDGQRVASVPVCYLARLTPEHQQRWKTHEVDDPCFMDPDYYRTSIVGAFPEKVSIYQACLEEMRVTNDMCKAAGLPSLFRDTFDERRPKYFRIPFRNTKEALHSSIEEMDKMFSQNLNHEFFQKVLRPEETYEERPHKKSGKVAIHDLGTLKLLTTWIGTWSAGIKLEPVSS